MKIYHSFFENGYKGISQEIYDLHKLSVLSCLKSYGNINLITTPNGKQFLGDLPYTSIEIFEHPHFTNISTTGDLSPYNNVWSLSKLIAYKQISQKREPFLHIDYDVFLFKKLPDNITNGEIICQHLENHNIINHVYFLPIFEELCKNKQFYDPNLNCALNCGIFGGHNFDFINFYVDSAISLLLEPSNQEYWKNGHLLVNKNFKGFENWKWQSGILEQLWLSQCVNHLKIKPSLLFELSEYDSLEHFSSLTQDISKELGYTHLISNSKEDPRIMSAVRRKISQIS